MDCSLPGPSVHEIFLARILEWAAISSPGDLPDPGIEPRSPALAGRFFSTESPGKPINQYKNFKNCCHLSNKSQRCTFPISLQFSSSPQSKLVLQRTAPSCPEVEVLKVWSSQSAATALSGLLLEMQIPGSPPRPAESEFLGVRPSQLCFNEPSRLFLEKAMAPHSSTLAWKIPWTEEPGRLQSMGSIRVGPD